MSETIIRKATKSDLQTLLHFEQEIIAFERHFDDTLAADRKINYYDLEAMLHSNDALVVVAVIGETVVASGFARIEVEKKQYFTYSKFAYLGFMYVHPAHRGSGINFNIIEALKKWVLSKGIDEIQLDVYADNLSAIKAYEKAGFTKNLLNMRMGIYKNQIQ